MTYVERFQIYVHSLGSLGVGASVTDVPKSVDTEAPFALRGWQVRIKKGATTNNYNFVNSLNIRRKNPAGMYTQTDLLPVPIALAVGSGGFGGIGGHPGLVYPQEIFPAGSQIAVDVKNTDPAQALDVTIYYWGVKLFPEGSIDAPTYPERCAMLDYARQMTFLAMGQTETRNNLLLKVAADADYVFRAAQFGCNNTFPAFPAPFKAFHNCLIKISDHNVKPFMDDFVDVNYLCGTSQGTFGQGSSFTGNAVPGLFVPEIYVRANDLMYIDLQRQDAAFIGGAGEGPNDLQIVFQGAKVYLK